MASAATVNRENIRRRISVSQAVALVVVILAMRSSMSSVELYVRMGCVLVWYLLAFGEDSKALSRSIASKPFVFAMLFVTIRTAFSLINCQSMSSVLGYGMSLFSNFSFIAMAKFYSSDEEKNRVISTGCLLIFVVFCVIGSVFYIQNPGAARSFVLYQESASIGGGYGLGYGAGVVSVCLLGVLLALRNHRTHDKRIGAIYVVVVLGIIASYLVQSTILLIAIVVGVVVQLIASIMGTPERGRRGLRLLGLAIGVLALVIFWTSIARWMIDLNGVVKNDVTDRVRAIGELWVNESRSVAISGRQDVYSESIEAFLSSPIFGAIASVPYEELSTIGNHSTFLDEFGRFGLLPGLCIVLTFWFYFWELPISRRFKYRGALATCLLIAMLNPITQASAMCMIFMFTGLFERSALNLLVSGSAEEVDVGNGQTQRD